MANLTFRPDETHELDNDSIVTKSLLACLKILGGIHYKENDTFSFKLDKERVLVLIDTDEDGQCIYFKKQTYEDAEPDHEWLADIENGR
jgi:hypothetical protein